MVRDPSLKHAPFSNAVIAAAVPVTAPPFVLRGLPRNARRQIKKAMTRDELQAFVDDIPDDFPAPTKTPEYVAPPTYFVHTPEITVFRGGAYVPVTGPIADIKPKRTKETEIGWSKYAVDAPEQIQVSRAAQAHFNRILQDFFDKRRDDKEEAYSKRCERAHSAGKPIPPRPEFKEPPPNWMTFIKDPELLKMYEAAQSNRKVRKRLEAFEHKRGPMAEGKLWSRSPTPASGGHVGQQRTERRRDPLGRPTRRTVTADFLPYPYRYQRRIIAIRPNARPVMEIAGELSLAGV